MHRACFSVSAATHFAGSELYLVPYRPLNASLSRACVGRSFIGLSPAAEIAKASPSCCGCKTGPTDCGNTKQGYKGPCSGAYTMTNFMAGESGPAQNPAYPLTTLANSILVEWHNNVNMFRVFHPAVGPCKVHPNKTYPHGLPNRCGELPYPLWLTSSLHL